MLDIALEVPASGSDVRGDGAGDDGPLRPAQSRTAIDVPPSKATAMIVVLSRERRATRASCHGVIGIE